MVSISSIGLTWHNNEIQNERWAELNAPDVHFTRLVPFTWERVQPAVLDERKWGYDDPVFSPTIADGVYSGTYDLHSRTMLYDRDNRPMFAARAARVTLTVEDAIRLASDKGIKDYVVGKSVSADFVFKNGGKIPAKNVHVQIGLHDWSDLNKPSIRMIIGSSDYPEIKPDEEVRTYVEQPFQLTYLFPDSLLFEVKVLCDGCPAQSRLVRYNLFKGTAGFR